MLFASFNAQCLGTETKDIDGSQFLVLLLKTDVYSPDGGISIPCQKSRKRGHNHQQYISPTDLDQLDAVQGLIPGNFYVLNVAVGAKSTGTNSAKPRYTILSYSPLEVKQNQSKAA